jgi:hypothetical protein
MTRRQQGAATQTAIANLLAEMELQPSRRPPQTVFARAIDRAA